MFNLSIHRTAKHGALTVATASIALAGIACGSQDEPITEPEPEPVILSSCPDLITPPQGAPFLASDILCAQEFIVTPDSILAQTIEDSIGEFTLSVDLTTEEIILLELAFLDQRAGGNNIELAGQNSTLKLIHQDGTTSVPDVWVQVNDPLRDLEALAEEQQDPGAAFLEDTFGGIADSLIGNVRDMVLALEHSTEPLAVNDDVLVWLPYIFNIDNPAVSLDYNGTTIPLTYSPIE